jgi:hypothetical protein
MLCSRRARAGPSTHNCQPKGMEAGVRAGPRPVCGPRGTAVPRPKGMNHDQGVWWRWAVPTDALAGRANRCSGEAFRGGRLRRGRAGSWPPWDRAPGGHDAPSWCWQRAGRAESARARAAACHWQRTWAVCGQCVWWRYRWRYRYALARGTLALRVVLGRAAALPTAGDPGDGPGSPTLGAGWVERRQRPHGRWRRSRGAGPGGSGARWGRRGRRVSERSIAAGERDGWCGVAGARGSRLARRHPLRGGAEPTMGRGAGRASREQCRILPMGQAREGGRGAWSPWGARGGASGGRRPPCVPRGHARSAVPTMGTKAVPLHGPFSGARRSGEGPRAGPLVRAPLHHDWGAGAER